MQGRARDERLSFCSGMQVVGLELLWDEPAGNLDAATLILVTHDEALAQHCNRQLRLVAGRVA